MKRATGGLVAPGAIDTRATPATRNHHTLRKWPLPTATVLVRRQGEDVPGLSEDSGGVGGVLPQGGHRAIRITSAKLADDEEGGEGGEGGVGFLTTCNGCAVSVSDTIP